jgi:hypothetical protein
LISSAFIPIFSKSRSERLDCDMIRPIVEGERMRIALRIVAGLLIAAGIVWILQGIGVLPGSYMSGQMQWAYRGAAIAVVGVAMLLFARRRG